MYLKSIYCSEFITNASSYTFYVNILTFFKEISKKYDILLGKSGKTKKTSTSDNYTLWQEISVLRQQQVKCFFDKRKYFCIFITNCIRDLHKTEYKLWNFNIIIDFVSNWFCFSITNKIIFSWLICSQYYEYFFIFLWNEKNKVLNKDSDEAHIICNRYLFLYIWEFTVSYIVYKQYENLYVWVILILSNNIRNTTNVNNIFLKGK